MKRFFTILYRLTVLVVSAIFVFAGFGGFFGANNGVELTRSLIVFVAFTVIFADTFLSLKKLLKKPEEREPIWDEEKRYRVEFTLRNGNVTCSSEMVNVEEFINKLYSNNARFVSMITNDESPDLLVKRSDISMVKITEVKDGLHSRK